MPANSFPEMDRCQKIEKMLRERGLEFTPPMRYKYFNDPMYKAIFTLVLELMEKVDLQQDHLNNWDPWEDF